jgi:hypothetical protein
VRLTRITGIDLRLFDFDHDLNFMVFLMSPDERVYGRYGGRDGKSAEGRLSLAGLKFALAAALEAHKTAPKEPPAPRPGKPLLAEEFAGAKQLRKGVCIHCHQVNEFRRADLKAEGKWTRDAVWRYPLPENVGLTLDNDEGNLVRSVVRDSPAGRAGLRPGDRLRTLHRQTIFSFADAQHALDRAPPQGEIEVTWQRDGKTQTASLKLEENWRRTNITWRPSLLDILVSPLLFGDDLSAKEKKALGLGEKRLAFRQDKPIPKDLVAAGLQEDDVIVGIDGLAPEMTVKEFLGHLRRNYLVGERAMLNVLRDGRRVDLPLTFR